MRDARAPHPLVLPAPWHRLVARRALGFWMGVRAIFLVTGLVAPEAPPPSTFVFLSPGAAAVAVLVVAALATLHGRRRHEHIFLANLGVPEGASAGLAAAAALGAELAVALAGALTR